MTQPHDCQAWDYSKLAGAYEQRADYSPELSQTLLRYEPTTAGARHVVDIGAGTGKLTRAMLKAGYHVLAVEPNAAMRAVATAMEDHEQATWVAGKAEALPLGTNQFDIATFASSFNVVDQRLALHEASRVLKPAGLLAIAWNHRDLSDPLQRRIEDEIRAALPGFQYGSRRDNPSQIVLESGVFSLVAYHRFDFLHITNHGDFVAAWRSHATLARAAGEAFPYIVERLSRLIPRGGLAIPFSSVVWLFRNTKRNT
jgi:ubiquinone/menaquinone biosynthesis C-methylase UbiE